MGAAAGRSGRRDRVLAWLGLAVLLVLHLDSWRPQRAVLYFGWMPEEPLWRLGWMFLAWLYLLWFCARLWRSPEE